MSTASDGQRATLRRIARAAMFARGLEPDFSPAALAEVARLRSAPLPASTGKDLRELPWASIDNDDSLDLDQLTVAAAASDGGSRVLVAIADVDHLVGRGSAIDAHARANTTSVYTAGTIFPMLPEALSTDLTSLADRQDRPAIVVDMTLAEDGAILAATVYPGLVRNHAKLAYNSVAAWLDGAGAPAPLAAVPGLENNLRAQDRLAQLLSARRHEHGAIDLETIEARPVFDAESIRDLTLEETNRAKAIIENLMIAANGVTARYLAAAGFPSMRRVVRSPKRWDRIVEVAAQHRVHLPAAPDPKALSEFLSASRRQDPLRFPDLSLTIVKLLGAGEYTVEPPGQEGPGHFGLAVRDYGHSTAPNRRYPDLLTQRLIKAALAGAPPPYPLDELAALAAHCTRQEDAANKVERQVAKSAAAMLLAGRVGERFDGIVTGAGEKGTWVRVLRPPVEGRVVEGAAGLDVGDRVGVELIATDVERGYIDFARAGRATG